MNLEPIKKRLVDLVLDHAKRTARVQLFITDPEEKVIALAFASRSFMIRLMDVLNPGLVEGMTHAEREELHEFFISEKEKARAELTRPDYSIENLN